jgi:hypothetical protein
MFSVSLARIGFTAVVAIGLAGCSDTQSPEASPDALSFEVSLIGRDFVQLERMGLPAIATVFIPTAKKDAYNNAIPANDPADYSADVIAVLTAFGHPNPSALAGALLPDAIPFNTGSTAGFLNGRRLPDDVITAELGLIFGSNTALNDDHVDSNDKAFLATFPYLARPHAQPVQQAQ